MPQGDDQLKGGGNADAENVEGHKDNVSSAGHPFGIERRELNVKVRANRHRNRRWREDKFN